MKKLRRQWKGLSALLALVMILAGCQSAAGLDVTKALLGNLDVRSSESSLTLTVKADPAVGIDEDSRRAVELINSLSVRLDTVKRQENGEVSATGSLGLKNYRVPFRMYLNNEVMAILPEGARHPYYIALADAQEQLGGWKPDAKKTEEIGRALTSLVVRNLPNPSVFSVTPVTENVYGRSLSLAKIHGEVTGDELPALLKGFLKSVSKDPEGLNQVVGGLYDYLLPLLKQEAVSKELDSIGLSGIPLDNKEEVVAVLQDALKLGLDSLILMYDKGKEELFKNTPELNTVLSKDTKLSADLYVDSGLHVRKEAYLLHIALPGNSELPLRSLEISAESQVWNLNGSDSAIQADAIATDGGLELGAEEPTPGTLLRNLDSQSDLYRLLKGEMGLTARTLYVDPVYDDYYETVNVKGTLMIPIRYLADDLDATVQWDAGSKTITVTDDVYGSTLVFKPGAKTAVIDGRTVSLPVPVFFDEYGTGYAPLRTLAAGLHAEIKTDEEGWIVVSRK
ncbi:copper amine oxidase N-terminal domain-containing protein [Paenibacillus spiritus]|uniref:Copper amine oxidase N-terminal domain-containing protein n=1 Tax=Paenibacillus spiritus TaxID=2496557 RepID=A0A5J5G8K2_9BACL|nr:MULTISPECIES: copper amine oxidase N-terminal domain-containing protein [Paenibacillus]KAA9004078.1 copper amine oxidase N-terminal domain-containing protein [Paenibacillus spiritus]